MIAAPSPNHGARPAGTKPDLVVIHYTGMPDAAAALARLRSPAAAVSAHYLIGEEGTCYSLVSAQRRAWHAGIGFWQGCTNVNDISIGIELVNPGHEFGYRDFPERQMRALLALLADLRVTYAIPGHRYIGHSDCAPGRKLDPGERFDWQRLAQAGFGCVPGTALDHDDRTPTGGHLAARALLAQIGYRMTKDTADLTAVLTAFQQHWRQSHVTGQLDAGTMRALSAMAAIMQKAGYKI